MKSKILSSKGAAKETEATTQKDVSTALPEGQINADAPEDIPGLRAEGIEDVLKRLINEKIQHSQNTRKHRNRMIYTLVPLGLLAPIFVSIGVYLRWASIMSMDPWPQAVFISLSFIIAISFCGFGFVSLKGERASNDEMGTLSYLNSIRGYQPPGSD